VKDVVWKTWAIALLAAFFLSPLWLAGCQQKHFPMSPSEAHSGRAP